MHSEIKIGQRFMISPLYRENLSHAITVLMEAGLVIDHGDGVFSFSECGVQRLIIANDVDDTADRCADR